MSLASSNLSKRRYAEHDDTLYVAPEDERTDYVLRFFSLCRLRSLNDPEFSLNRPWQTGIVEFLSAYPFCSSALFGELIPIPKHGKETIWPPST
jgi:hypothetical protein